MEVTRYLFQSTSTSQVQIGTPDPSVKQEAKAKEQTDQLAKDTNIALQKADDFVKTQSKPVQPQVNLVEKVQASKNIEPSQATQEDQIVEDLKGIETSRADDVEKKRNIWERGKGDLESMRNNIWSRRTDETNNIWAGSSMGNFTNIWLKNNDDS